MASLLLSNKPMRTQQPIIKTKFNLFKLKSSLISFEQKSPFITVLNLKREGFLSPVSASSGDLLGIPTPPPIKSIPDHCEYEDLSHLIDKVKGFDLGHVKRSPYSSCIPLSEYTDTIILVKELLICMQRSGTDLPGFEMFRLNIDIDTTELKAIKSYLSGVPSPPPINSIPDHCDYVDLSHLIVKVKDFELGHVDRSSYSTCIPLSEYTDTIILVDDLFIFMQRCGTDLPGFEIFKLNIDIDLTELKAIKNDPQINNPNESDCDLYVLIPPQKTRLNWMNVVFG